MIGREFVDFFEHLLDNPNTLRGYQAKLGEEKNILSSRHTGISVTGVKNLSNKQSYQGFLAIGATGTGKTATIIVPTAYSAKNASLVFNDPSGELYDKTSGYLKEQGYEIKVLNFADALRSSGFNPFTWAPTQSKKQKIAHMLVESALGGSPKDPYWSIAATGILLQNMNILATQEEQYQTLYNVRQLLVGLAANPKGIDKLFTDHASDADFDEYKSFIALDEKLQTSIISTAKAALQLFTDEHVAKVTSFNTIDFDSFRTTPTALYVKTSIGDAKYLSSLVAVFFQLFFSHLLERFPNDDERDIFFLMDEAASLKIPVLPLAMANCRKHRVGIALMVQSEQQLIQNYGKADAESIITNAVSKLYFSGQDIDTAQKLERLLGKTEIIVEDENDKEKKRKEVVPLMTADTIRSLPANKAIMLSGSSRPILVKLSPYYENPTYRRYSHMPAPKQQSQLPFFTIPKIPLQTPDDDED